MTDAITALTRKTSLRKACKELSLAEMEKLAANISDLLEERKAEEAAKREADQEKQQKIEALKKEFLDAGIEISEFLDSIQGATTTKKKAAVKPKYEIRDENGELHQWTGRGRTPKVFKAYFDKGGRKEDCLIK